MMKSLTTALVLLALVGAASATALRAQGKACDSPDGCEGDDCHPKCQWKCDSPVCNQVCEPVCEQPKCSTRCQELGCSKCQIKCDAPECEVRCPVKHCEKGKCPECDTVCKEPVCHTECTNPQPKCESVCEEPMCDWKCHRPLDCAKPKCALVCEKAPHCQPQPEEKKCCECAEKAVEAALADKKCCECEKAGNAQAEHAGKDALHLHCRAECDKKEGAERDDCNALCDNLHSLDGSSTAAKEALF